MNSATNADEEVRASDTVIPPTPMALMRNLQAVTRALNRGDDKSNTNKAYDPKEKEYYLFCDHVYGAVAPLYRYIVDFDRLYLLLYYQAFREKKSQKGVKKGSGTVFSASDYDSVMHK